MQERVFILLPKYLYRTLFPRDLVQFVKDGVMFNGEMTPRQPCIGQKPWMVAILPTKLNSATSCFTLKLRLQELPHR
jgi:hypothetical protein